jgi:hypothetical protein
MSGTPVLALDVRERKPLYTAEGATRDQLIEAAKAQIDEFCTELLSGESGGSGGTGQEGKGLAETLDVCTLAVLHDVLTGDGDSLTSEVGGSGMTSRNGAAVPLHEAIRGARENKGGSSKDDGVLARATPEKIEEVGPHEP